MLTPLFVMGSLHLTSFHWSCNTGKPSAERIFLLKKHLLKLRYPQTSTSSDSLNSQTVRMMHTMYLAEETLNPDPKLSTEIKIQSKVEKPWEPCFILLTNFMSNIYLVFMVKCCTFKYNRFNFFRIIYFGHSANSQNISTLYKNKL